MRAMKDSGIEWIGKIPKEWNVEKIKFSYKVVNGATPKTSNLKYWDGDICWITPADYSNGISFIKSSKKYITEEGLNSCGTQLVPAESIIISNRAPIGNVSIAGISLCTNQGCKSLVVHELGGSFMYKYMYYFLSVQSEKLNSLGQGTTFLELSSFDLANFKISKPSYKEQLKISSFLDSKCAKIDEYLSRQQQVIEKLKEYKQSVITEAVTKGLDPDVPMRDSGVEWIGKIPDSISLIKLKFIGTVKNGLTYKPEDLRDDGILVLRSSNIIDDQLAFDNNVYVDKSIVSEDIKVNENDILICSRNGSRNLIGKSALIDKSMAGNTFGAFMCIFRSPYNKYLKYVLHSNIFSYYLGTYLTSTINQLTKGNLKNMVVPITRNKVLMEQIISYLDTKCAAIDAAIKRKQELIDKMTEYKKSLIYEAVTGKMEV